MNRKKTLATTMQEFLEDLGDPRYSEKEKTAVVLVNPSPEENEWGVALRVYLGNGADRSDALIESERPITPELFNHAVRKGYVTKAINPGFVSEEEFVITHLGIERYIDFQIQKRDALRRRQSV